MNRQKNCKVGLVCVVLMGLLMASPVLALDVFGESYVFLVEGEDVVVGEGCTLYGQTVVGNATLTLDGGVITEATDQSGNGLGDGALLALEGSIVHIYAGIISESTNVSAALTVGETAQVTIYGSNFELDDVSLDPSQTTVNSGSVLSGVYENGESFTMTIDLYPNASIALGWPQTAPEIEVYPALLVWDFGDIEVGESTTVLVQIFNFGTADLNVSSVAISGDAEITITDGPATPLVIAPNTSVGVDFEVTFAPTAEAASAAVVIIESDDEDESVVYVDLSGVGIITEVPPTQQIQDILDYFDASVADGTLVGYGPGNSASKRLKALKNMIESASDLINAGAYAQAIEQLESISKKIDGVSKPQDFAVGDAAAVLNTMINDLIADLAS